ncbi:MAG: LPS export ABC transporter periplasmic protein LptC [Albidovulum sp.]
MAVRDNVHSQVVFWLKIVLPLIALAILSTLFLFSRRIDTDAALPYAEVDVEDLARNQRLTAPHYAGITADGAEVTVTAGVARPVRDSGAAEAESVSARYEMRGGLSITLDARQGVLDDAASRLILAGDVEIATSTGYRVTAARLVSALDRTELHSDGAVRAEAPFGTIDAGRLEVRHMDAEVSGYLVVFSEGVKLVYRPAKKDP